MSLDPNTWYVSLPNGLPRISSPIILQRDTTTQNYLAHKRSLQGLSLQMTRKIWKLHQQSFARRATIIKLITGWNVDGSRYALYTSDPKAKATNSRCPLCLATDSDLHWICDCPCPVLKDHRDSLLDTAIPIISVKFNNKRSKNNRTYYHKYRTYVEHSELASATAPTGNHYGKVHGQHR